MNSEGFRIMKNLQAAQIAIQKSISIPFAIFEGTYYVIARRVQEKVKYIFQFFE